MSTAANPQGYPGNPSLPKEVREKILSTFRHTLNLFKEGKQDDCLIGCDFILKMDPRFVPARQLMEKAKNPAAAVDVRELESIVAETPTRQERVSTIESERLLVRAVESFNARDFDAAIAAADQVLQVLPGNQSATAIRDKARQRKEGQPQFDAARQRAIAALDAGKPAEARVALEKMRALDGEHPAVALLERRLQAPEVGEIGESTNPGLGSSSAGRSAPPPSGGLDELSLDSLSLDEPLQSPLVVPPPPDLHEPRTGPLSLSNVDFSGGGGAGDFSGGAADSSVPPDLWSGGLDEVEEAPAVEPATMRSVPPTPAAPVPQPPSQEQEIESLLNKGDEASRAGNPQQAIEIWSRIFLIDINNS
ncbi:MAG TPA: hypothetical protein VK780_00565, partial [Thermoanaerobaculia bacterium]|nr:hypothetical protein [Thermoanaerobaculia bacterium]